MMLPPRVYKKWLRVFCRPVLIAQTRRGLLAAAVLVVFCQLHRDALADHLTNPGMSPSTYFRVEWDYDLVLGTGLISLIVNDNQPNDFLAFFESLSFQTKGIELTDVEAIRPFDTSPVTITGNVSGTMDGLDLFTYEIAPGGGQSYVVDDRVDVTFNLPTSEVEFWDGDLSGVAVLSAAVPPLTNLSTNIPLLSVQRIIPEPSSLGVLGMVAGLLGFGRWREASRRGSNGD